ncbi:hypothetical protein SAMN02982927_00344 [Sporolactobacillus nakayamae]|uniref:Uncharacterized protein n=1 Tax=Sporolactobacillus nakayamae TaxID=269670 RepID=A0A1I2NDU3_9BACL|nr:hypothetical protein SAMN02982927_00344 [Sporolactobacillus nakayamae]
MPRLISIQLKMATTKFHLLGWLILIVCSPLVQFLIIRQGYQYFKPVEVFQNTVSGLIALLRLGKRHAHSFLF